MLLKTTEISVFNTLAKKDVEFLTIYLLLNKSI